MPVRGSWVRWLASLPEEEQRQYLDAQPKELRARIIQALAELPAEENVEQLYDLEHLSPEEINELTAADDDTEEEAPARAPWGKLVAFALLLAAVAYVAYGHRWTVSMPMSNSTSSSTATLTSSPTFNWYDLGQKLAPAVSIADMSTYGTSNGTGTAYVAWIPWPKGSGQTGLTETVVTAWHVVCTPTAITKTDTVTAWGGEISSGHTADRFNQGLCQSILIGGNPAEDIASFPWSGFRAKSNPTPLTLAPSQPAVGAQVLVMGHPDGSTQLIFSVGKVLATNTEGYELGERGNPEKLLKHITVIQANVAPGNSGSPVVNRQGQVIGTLVAAGPQKINGKTITTADVVPWQANMAPEGYVQKDGMINQTYSCGSGVRGWLCRMGW